MSKKNRRGDGVMSLILFGLLFGAGGIMAITKPVGFASPGANGAWGHQLVTTVYRPSETRGVGVFFLLISAFIFIVALRLVRGGKDD